MVDIRRAISTDCGRIAEIQVAGWKSAYRGILPDDYLDRMCPEPRVAIWERFVRNEPGQLLVADIGSEIAGFCHLVPSRDTDADQTAEIAAIYIDPIHWRMGYGKSLCTAACKSAKDQGFRSLTLWVLEENTRGRHFYEAMGLKPDGATKTEKRPGFTLEEARYRMKLAGE